MLKTYESPADRVGAALPFDVKALASDGSFEGYASTFNGDDLAGDTMLPGAFAKTLKKRGARGIKMLNQHNPAEPIGVWTALKEDDRGLLAKGQLILDLSKAQEVYTQMKHGMVDGLSIGFSSEPDGYAFKKGGRGRIFKAVDLMEVSVVTFPCDTRATAHSVKSYGLTARAVEKALRDAGHSRAEAMKVVSSLKHLLRDAEDEPATDEPPRDADGLADLLRALEQRAAILTP